MGIFRRKKKKDEEKKKKPHVDIDWRLTPGEYLKLMFYGSLLLYFGVISSFHRSSISSQ